MMSDSLDTCLSWESETFNVENYNAVMKFMGHECGFDPILKVTGKVSPARSVRSLAPGPLTTARKQDEYELIANILACATFLYHVMSASVTYTQAPPTSTPAVDSGMFSCRETGLDSLSNVTY
jgi:hypothetical protein